MWGLSLGEDAMSLQDDFWDKQLKIYCSQPYKKEIRYEAWQPARWSANRAAIKILKKYFNSISSSYELGAGSAAFSFELKKQLDINISGIDLSQNAKKYACMLSDDMGLPIHYITSDLFSSYQEADLILSLGVIEHFDKDKQIQFINKCKEISRKYVLIAIPNQKSLIFNSYLKWVALNDEQYEEDHKVLDTEDLTSLFKEAGLNVLYEDGFQFFLSERKFWNDINLSDIPLYNSLKDKFCNRNDKWKNFPNIDFGYDDIPEMVDIEMSLGREERLVNCFMTYVLAEKRR